MADDIEITNVLLSVIIGYFISLKLGRLFKK